jgi:hypothetical protein
MQTCELTWLRSYDLVLVVMSTILKKKPAFIFTVSFLEELWTCFSVLN